MDDAELRSQLARVGRRRAARLRTRLAMRLITLDGQCQATLLDLSQTGAHLAVPHSFATGADAVLCWADFEAFGRIVWFRAGECGIEFDEPLPEQVLMATRGLDGDQIARDDVLRAAERHVRGAC